jgi:hypothetical protein
MKSLVVAACFAMLPFTLLAKPQFFSVEDYQQTKQTFRLSGSFPELLVLNAKQDIVLQCDAKKNETEDCFDKVQEMTQQSDYVISLYTLDAPFCPLCLSWNTQVQQMTEQAKASVSIYYVGN